MDKRMVETGRESIGVDVSDKYSQICVLDAAGEVVEETRVRTTDAGFRRYFGKRAATKVTLEAGTHSPWQDRLLKELGHDVLVVNPRRLELISRSVSKNDRNDAELLARMRRADARLLAPIEHRSGAAQTDLEVIRARDTLVRSRTSLVNHVRGAVKSAGHRLPKCSAPSLAKRARAHLPVELQAVLDPLLKVIETLTLQIRAYDKRVASLCESSYPETARLQQVNGVGALTALCFVLTIDDPTRFKRSRSVGAFLGLRPRQNESGSSSPELRITKAGDRDLRRLLVQCAQYVLGPFGKDCDLRRWGVRLQERGGKNAKKRAIVAVARKLAVLLHRLWITGAEYEPLRNTQRRGAKAA